MEVARPPGQREYGQVARSWKGLAASEHRTAHPTQSLLVTIRRLEVCSLQGQKVQSLLRLRAVRLALYHTLLLQSFFRCARTMTK